MMSCAASHGISKNYAERPLWKALGSCFLVLHLWNVYVQHGPLLLGGDGTDPGVRGSNSAAAAHCENMHAHCILMQFNWDQVSSRQLRERRRDLRRDSRGNGRRGCKRKDKKWHQQSNLSVFLRVGRGRVRHAICVFILSITLFHKSMRLFFHRWSNGS